MKQNTKIWILKSFLSLMIAGIVYVLLGFINFNKLVYESQNKGIEIEIKYRLKVDQPVAFYYIQHKIHIFNKDQMLLKEVKGSKDFRIVRFFMPKDTTLYKMRFDIGNSANDDIGIEYIKFKNGHKETVLHAKEILKNFEPNKFVSNIRIKGNRLFYNSDGIDAHFSEKKDRNISKRYNRIATYRPASMLRWVFTIIVLIIVFFYLVVARKDMTLSKDGFYTNAFIVLFFALLLLPFLDKQFEFTKNMNENEKRVLVRKAEFTINKLFSYPKSYEKYFNDRFGMRKALIYGYSYLHVYLFHQSPFPDKVVMGKNWWLYSAEALKPLESKVLFTEDQLERMKIKLLKTRQIFRQHGIKFYVVILPTKATIYPEYLPSTVVIPNKISKLDQVINYMRKHTDMEIIDVRKSLLEEKAKMEKFLFYTDDTHWNYIGGYFGYRDIINAIKKDNPRYAEYFEPIPFSDFEIRNKRNNKTDADLSRMISLNNDYPRNNYDLFYKKEYTTTCENIDKKKFPKRTKIYTGSNPKAPTLIMYRNSFAKALFPNLPNHFSKSVFLWSTLINTEETIKMQPDIVIYQTTETFIDDLITM